MNSGIRFSVALIVVIMVLLGFYYASLDDGASEDAGGQPTPAIVVDETDAASPIITVVEPLPVREPSEVGADAAIT